jgi:hypothetical protein
LHPSGHPLDWNNNLFTFIPNWQGQPLAFGSDYWFVEHLFDHDGERDHASGGSLVFVDVLKGLAREAGLLLCEHLANTEEFLESTQPGVFRFRSTDSSKCPLSSLETIKTVMLFYRP